MRNLIVLSAMILVWSMGVSIGGIIGSYLYWIVFKPIMIHWHWS